MQHWLNWVNPMNKYLFKVNNKSLKTTIGICILIVFSTNIYLLNMLGKHNVSVFINGFE